LAEDLNRFLLFKIFSQKNSAKKSAFLTQTKGNFAEKVIITLVFEKNANFFAENWQKSQEIVIITSTPERIFEDRIFVSRIKSAFSYYLFLCDVYAKVNAN
jgi:hypothetical protein